MKGVKRATCFYCGDLIVLADDGAWVRPIGPPENREGSTGCQAAVKAEVRGGLRADQAIGEHTPNPGEVYR